MAPGREKEQLWERNTEKKEVAGADRDSILQHLVRWKKESDLQKLFALMNISRYYNWFHYTTFLKRSHINYFQQPKFSFQYITWVQKSKI